MHTHILKDMQNADSYVINIANLLTSLFVYLLVFYLFKLYLNYLFI